MFRISFNEDVTNDEWNNYISKQIDDQEDYLKRKVIPEFVAFSIFNGYSKGYLELNDYDIHISSCLDLFNLYIEINDVKDKATEILKKKYGLTIISEKPLDFRR